MPKGIMSEEGFETMIVQELVAENGYEEGSNDTYDMHYCLDTERLFRFLKSTQASVYNAINLDNEGEREKFLKRLSDEITRRGIIDVLKKGIQYYPSGLVLFYLLPNEKNPKAVENYGKNIFSVTRQLHYSEQHPGLAIDLVIFVNGIPVITMELKNRITRQTYENAIRQYKTDRDPKERLLSFKRCLVHFAMDECEAWFTTRLEGKRTFFMPFNKGNRGGAGNPVNPNGTMTDYIWKDLLQKRELTNIIENYAQVITEKKGPRKKEIQVFPRYHQWRVVRRILADVEGKGLGQKYLVQHSAGSGKSNSITWLAYQLAGMERDGKALFDSIIVVTDRRNLDRQLTDNLKHFMQVSSALGHADDTKTLKELLVAGKKIVVSTVQKFPFLLDTIGKEMKDRNFGIIIDEAHSSQSGKASASMNAALSGAVDKTEEKDLEDIINEMIEGRKMLENASYFAFTATPKAKTLEMFGVPDPVNPDRSIPFDNYSMKQAIEEGFILDVLSHYTSIESYYKVAKIIEDNPEYDSKKAKRKIRKFVEGKPFALREKAEIMLEHFHECTVRKIGGRARAMVVTGSIERAIDYYYLFMELLEARNSPYRPIVAFSGKKEYKGKELTESLMNGFSDRETPGKFKENPYRFLIVADKYQTGFDEPLLHTMYVDKVLNDVKAVQTLSRLNRCMYGKNDTCVLDFANDPKEIQESFSRFYTVTELDGHTDPNKLYDLLGIMEKHQIYDQDLVESVCEKFFGSEDRALIDSMLDGCVNRYNNLDEDEQVEFKSSAKAFVRGYNFLASILPIGQADWEKMCIFLTLLVPKLPAPKVEDLSVGVLEAIDLDSYRAEKKEEISISLLDDAGTVKPGSFGVGKVTEVELDPLDRIVKDFNDIFGNIAWTDKDNVARQIRALPDMVARNEKVVNAIRNSGEQNAKMESDKALMNVIISIMNDHMELFKQYNSNKQFQKWLADSVFKTVYKNETEGMGMFQQAAESPEDYRVNL